MHPGRPGTDQGKARVFATPSMPAGPGWEGGAVLTAVVEMAGVEPASPACSAGALPLSYIPMAPLVGVEPTSDG